MDALSLDSSTTPKTTPSSTPRKRKAIDTPKTPTKKDKESGKNMMVDDEDSETEAEAPVKMEVKHEKDLGKVKFEMEEA